MPPFTKTNIAKYAVKLGVASYAAKFSNKVLADNTNIDPDGIPAKIGCAVIGEIVSSKAQPYTDRLVELTIVRYQDWKASKNVTE